MHASLKLSAQLMCKQHKLMCKQCKKYTFQTIQGLDQFLAHLRLRYINGVTIFQECARFAIINDVNVFHAVLILTLLRPTVCIRSDVIGFN